MKIKTLFGVSLVSLLLMSCGGDNLSLSHKPIDQNSNNLRKARHDKDHVNAARLQFEINRQQELKEAGDNIFERERIARKYELLGIVLDDEITDFRANLKLPEAERHPQFRGVKWESDSDEAYDGPDFTSVYHPLVKMEVQRVYKEFGPLYVNETKDDKGRPGFHSREAPRPWAGYWYQFSQIHTLFKGENAPLVKYQAVLAKKGIKARIVEQEIERFDGFLPDHWEGLCFARAAAAIMVPEPTAPLTIEGIRFGIGDQKALHTFAHLMYPHTQYGITFRGTSKTDGTYQDLKPEAVHHLLDNFLKEGRAPIVDDTAGPQVWNKPLFKFRWKIDQDPKYDFAFTVKAYASYLKERQEETDVLTGLEDDILTRTYTYRLYVDKKDKNRVIASQWTGRSFDDHPDTVTYLHKTGEPGSHNEEFNKNISRYKSLFMNLSSQVR